MGLAQALKAALDSDPDLAAIHVRIKAAQAGKGASWAPFIPRLKMGIAVDRNENPLVGPFYSYFYPDFSTGELLYGGNVGVEGAAPSGTRYRLSLSNGLRSFTSFGAALNPQYETGLHLNVSQGLWKGVMPDAAFADQNAAEAQVSVQDAAMLELRDATFRNTARAWLDLWRAQALVDLQTRSVKMAEDFLKLTKQLIRGGQLSKLDEAVAKQTVAGRKATLARALADKAQAERLLASALYIKPDVDGGAPLSLKTADFGDWPMPEFTKKIAIEKASSYNPTLKRLNAEIGAAKVGIARAEDARRPDIRLNIRGDLIGLAGQSTCVDGTLSDGFSPCGVPPPYEGGYLEANANMALARFYGIHVGLQGDIPTFWGPNNDGVERARLTQNALERNLEAQRIRLSWIVERDLTEVKLRKELLDAARAAVDSAKKSLEAEELKFTAGRSTGLSVLQNQDLVINSQLAEVDAHYQLGMALASFRATVGQLMPDKGQFFGGQAAVATPATAPSPGNP
jgi:outer membrane protein TolC